MGAGHMRRMCCTRCTACCTVEAWPAVGLSAAWRFWPATSLLLCTMWITQVLGPSSPITHRDLKSDALHL